MSTLQRAVDILETLAEKGAAPAPQLIESSGIPKSTGYLLLKELQRLGLITQDDRGNYRLGMRLMALGERASAQIDAREASLPHLTALMEKTGFLCHFGVFDGEVAYYVLKIESQSAISVRSYVGKRVSLYRSGLGKCLLAWQPEALRESIIRSIEFDRSTPTTITTADELRQELALIRERGWGYDNGEEEPAVRCVAAPVFNARGGVAGAISAVGTTIEVSEETLVSLSKQVRDCAYSISHDLGWTEGLTA